MNKDVIYIDVEDDITAIIGKVKASKEKIVALVPPKRIGVLQSAVNLRLLVRMAKNAEKQLVLVTNNQALIGLSAAAAIPVAKNLQSKPELATIPALSVDDGEDVIDGSQLPIGELEKTADVPAAPIAGSAARVTPKEVENLVDTIDVDGEEALAPVVGMATAPKKPLQPKSNIKIPNFGKFRKRLFIGIIALVVLVGFIVWANVFAPAATIVITAKTSAAPVSETLTLASTPTNVAQTQIQTETKTIKKDMSIKFTPTGSEDLGAKATGTVELSALSQSATDVPNGTVLQTSDGNNFVTQADATIPASVSCFPRYCAQSTTVQVQADTAGTKYNGESGALSGAPSGVSATFSGQTAGGTSNVQTVVSASDIATATTQLNAMSTSSNQTALQQQFTNGELVISNSFTTTRGTPTSSPALNAQASGSATLTESNTYTMIGLQKSDVESFLKASLAQQISGTTDQKVYDDGITNATLSNYNNSDAAATISVTATGQVGPNIDTSDVKTQSLGKKSGEVEQTLEAIQGVSGVNVKFSYPWVTSVPNDIKKVDVQFKLTHG